MTFRATILGASLFALLLVLSSARPGSTAPERAVEPAGAATAAAAAREKEEALDLEEAAKLRQLREEQELRRREAARKLNAELKRQAEISRLRATMIGHEQRESTLHHEVRSLQHQMGTVSRDPSDHSAMARRMDLERQLGYTQNQLNYATRSREGAARRLDDLHPRY